MARRYKYDTPSAAYEEARWRIAAAQRTRVKNLDFSDLGLRSLPPQIRDLKALTHLSLDNNQLTALPPEIGQLTALKQLSLDNNQLTALPSEITQLTALTMFSLQSNPLTSFPLQITQLTDLTRLDLNNSQLTALPPEIGNLTALKVLSLQIHQLTSLPPELGKLTALEALLLGGNQFTSFPPEIVQLRALTRLYLNNNQLTALPHQIGQLTALEALILDGNQLTSLPPEIGQLTDLTDLLLKNNQLTALPREIGQLTKLLRLWLHGNQLNSLPPEIGQLRALSYVSLHDNPALGLPSEVLGQHPEREEITRNNCPAVLDYYFARLEQGERPLNEVKLLLVGRGEAGKTSVSRALRGEAFTREQRETPGIEIKAWDLDCPGAEAVKVHLWDFAGQEITHETHRFFLTERSLYLVVLDGRGGQQMEEAEYWLSHVEKFGTRRSGEKEERSPVIVVLNKWASPAPYDVEQRRLQREYPNIRAFVKTDCATGLGLAELRETICAVLGQMPSVRQKWPKSYFDVRQALLARAEHPDPDQRCHYLKWEAYRAVCTTCGVTEQERQELLAENLNALGVALYY